MHVYVVCTLGMLSCILLRLKFAFRLICGFSLVWAGLGLAFMVGGYFVVGGLIVVEWGLF